MIAKKVSYIQIAMLALNIIAVMFMSIFVWATTNLIRGSYVARQFLEGVRALPSNPQSIVYTCALLLALLTLSYALRKTAFKNDTRLIYCSFVVDFITSITIVFLLDFNYNGILLFVFANLVAYTRGTKGRFMLMVLAVISFLGANYELMSISYKLYSVRDYIACYNSNIQQYLFGLYNSLISLNIIVFIIYCVIVIQKQQGTIDEVNILYQRLSQVNRDLENANAQLQDYALMTEKMGQTRERNRLAREIHDTLGHTLTGISAGIDACIATIDNSPDDTKRQLELIAKVTRAGITDVRRSVNQLRTDAIERLSLEHAITKMITDITSVTQTPIFFDNRLQNLKFDEDEENAIYRVIQESLTNAIRHGKATKIWIEMKKQGDEVLLTIRDNGCGCADIKSGFGTRHIRERIYMLGGTVTFDGSDGFVVRGSIPIRRRESDD